MLDDKKTLMQYCVQVVDRLILQYREYLFLNNQIKELENNKFIELLKDKDKEKLQSIEKKVTLIKRDLAQVSNEMTFANPIIWMMYKYKAYKNTSNEIATLSDFRKHCEPDGYICTKRYKFLSSYLRENYSIDIDDKSKYSDDKDLKGFCETDLIINLVLDLNFMRLWKEKEYLISNNSVNKWQTETK